MSYNKRIYGFEVDENAAKEYETKVESGRRLAEDIARNIPKDKLTWVGVRSSRESYKLHGHIGELFVVKSINAFGAQKDLAHVAIWTGWNTLSSTAEIQENDPKTAQAIEKIFPAERDKYVFRKAHMTGPNTPNGRKYLMADDRY